MSPALPEDRDPLHRPPGISPTELEGREVQVSTRNESVACSQLIPGRKPWKRGREGGRERGNKGMREGGRREIIASVNKLCWQVKSA